MMRPTHAEMNAQRRPARSVCRDRLAPHRLASSAGLGELAACQGPGDLTRHVWSALECVGVIDVDDDASESFLDDLSGVFDFG